MNKTNFNQTGGFPLKTERLQELQTAFMAFNALGQLAGNLTIISGCETVGTTVRNGFVFIDGELLEFREASGVFAGSQVIIVDENIDRAFENGTIKTVHTLRYATIGTAEISWPWSSFERPIPTKSIQAFQTLVIDRITAIEAKLNTIEIGAQKNVQSDWNVTDVLSDAYIKNKIAFNSPFLRKDVFYVGNVGSNGNVNDTKMTVTFPSVGTSNYMVLGSLRGRSAYWNDDNDVFWTYGGETSTSFEIYLREIVANNQNLNFYYVLIPLS
ncbi:hypothetical protein N4T20_02455 [Flavobacterium sp. TR2]|uniref:hypothetical protein n=1 Tax=Flavobacterium sp. TR2 TaxID=2977321 RepID=UPI0021B14C32|nr:hypothetical protein [Flavobacterium sp. TR2]UWY28792.1 hypothetical protein N4T20_02455 [Flavobacterium sp. TR2]